MDGETRELIAHLFTRIGMIMEDASTVALLAGSGDQVAHEEAAVAIEQAAEKIAALASAINALLDK